MALLPSDPKRQKQLLIGLLPLLILFGYWYFFHGSKTDEIAALERHHEQLETKNATALAQSRTGGPDLEQRVALYEQYMERLEQLIPQREEVPDLLHAMTQQAQQTGVELVLMRPQSEQTEPYYNRQTYQIAVAGGYHAVGRYLASIGSLPRVVAPIELRMIPVRAGVRDDAAMVEAQFRIYTYIVPQDAPVSANGEGGGNASR